ncbi:MAG: carbohydrate-binding family 9-like protein [Lentisphaerae bacterium]|nr:carbohydrate-binding family 9-like protein [Lentisphaerota bacterium]
MPYIIKKAVTRPSLKGQWDEAAWKNAEVLTLGHFHPKSSEHRPLVQAKLAWMEDGLFVFFAVKDQYVRCTRTDYQASVCCDSCAEFFVRPKPDRGYFNFEINAIGTLLLFYIEDSSRDPDEGFAGFTRVPWKLGKQVTIHHSLSGIVYPEIEKPTAWTLEYFIPFSLFEAYVGPLGELPGQTWMGNFYKCADQCSHPHWATWSPIGEKLNFHVPESFAPLKFGNA